MHKLVQFAVFDFCDITDCDSYPYNLPVLTGKKTTLDLSSSVTIFAGNNGSGKSTILKMLAELVGLNTQSGSANHLVKETQYLVKNHHDLTRLSWIHKTNQGFFLNAEGFTNFTHYIDHDHDISRAYNFKFQEHSHGETFLRIIKTFRKGVIILDEPEAALSIQSQFILLKVMHDLVKQEDIQFIVSTHSPILMTFPNAKIYDIKNQNITESKVEELESFNLYRDFMSDYKRFQFYLFKDDK